MARTKKTETKKTTTKKTTKKSTKKVVEEFPVDDIINDLKGTLITENSDQVGCKKKFKESAEEKPKEEPVVEEETIKAVVALEPLVDEIPESEEEAYKEKIEQNAEEVNQKVADNLEDFSVEEIREIEEDKPEVEDKKESFLKKARKIVTSHKWMGQIIDF